MIPFLSLDEIHASMRPDLDAALARVMDSGVFLNGLETERFEVEFCEWLGGGHGAATSSGTSALHLLLHALDIGPDDEVIVPSLTFVATAAAVAYTGAQPVAVDVDPLRWTIAPEAVRKALTPRTRAIVAVHLHGQPADMPSLRKIADEYDLHLIEDAAQAHGASIGGVRTGLLGDAAAFSFYPGKNLGSLGEGGMVVSRSETLIERIRLLRNWSAPTKYTHEEVSFSLRMHELQAAVLREKLKRLDSWNARRAEVADTYAAALISLDCGLPTRVSETEHCFHIFAISAKERDDLRRFLASRGVETGVHYPLPLHHQPGYQDLIRTPHPLPTTEHLCASFVSLPMSPSLRDDQIDTIARLLVESI